MSIGIDVSYAQGDIDWRAVRNSGVDFVMLKASQGKLLADASVGPFRDPKFYANIRGAAENGLRVGVYHYLCASGGWEALREADFFLRTIEPYRRNINLYAAVDVEEDRYLPSGKAALTGCVNGFCEAVRNAGYKPMVYTNPNYLQYRLGDVSGSALWLAYWGVPEASAKRYSPVIWQYGTTKAGTMQTVDGDVGYFDDSLRRGDKVRVIKPEVYGTGKRFVTYSDVYDVISVSGDRVVIGIGTAVTAAVAADNLMRI